MKKRLLAFVFIFGVGLFLTACKVKETYNVKFVDHDSVVLKEQLVVSGRAAAAPQDPTRVGYDFIGWDQDFSNVLSDLTITATYKIKTFTVVWKNYDGTILQTNENVEWGSMPVYEGIVPSKLEDKMYKYEFSGWSPTVSKAISDIEYIAEFSGQKRKYNVTFIDYDGTNLKEEIVVAGDSATAPKDPKRGDYLFVGWDQDFSNVLSDLTITATYKIKTFTVVWKGYDGTILKEEIVVIGNSATAPKDLEREGYVFLGWNQDFSNILSDLTITATYKIKTFTVVWKNYDGTILQTDENVEWGSTPKYEGATPEKEYYKFVGWDQELSVVKDNQEYIAVYVEPDTKFTVKFFDYDEKLLKEEIVVVGNSATAPEDPKRDGYLFIGWDQDFNKVLSDLTITATYKIKTFTVVWKNYDGSVLATNEVEMGKSAEYHGDTPIKPSTEKYTYKFIGWTPNVGIITENKEYTAQYEEVLNKYKVTFVNYDGTKLKEEIVVVGNFATAPEEPKRVGCDFIGWDQDFSNVLSNLTITATYKLGNHLAKLLLTEQGDVYDTQQQLSFNGVAVIEKTQKKNFTIEELKQYIITSGEKNLYLKPGTYSIILLSGRAEGVLKSPGLFLLSETYSELPEGTTINGATTVSVNGLERNRFYETNNDYIEVDNNKYSEIVFTVSENGEEESQFKLSFVPVYAVDESGLNKTTDKNGLDYYEINDIAGFGTMSEALNFADNVLVQSIANKSTFNQTSEIEAKHVFGELGEQAVFVRPVSTTLSDITYDGKDRAIKNANIFIGLHQGGGNFALFIDGIKLVKNLNVENTTVVRGAEKNSTINESIFIRRFTNVDGYTGRNEYKLKIGGVASGVDLLENITASNLNVNLGKITVVNENGNKIEKDVIAYVGGIAGITGTYGALGSKYAYGIFTPAHFSAKNILNSWFTGEISLTNVNGIVGGVVGLNVSAVHRTKSEATINASGYIGGIVGENRGYVQYSTFEGSVAGNGIVGGIVGLNNSIYFDNTITNSNLNIVRANILNGSVKLQGANQNQFAIWHMGNAEETYNNYGGGFIGVSALTVFESNYSNSNETVINGTRIAPFIGLVDYKYPAGLNTMFIRDNYFTSTRNNVVNTNGNKIPALGYWVNVNEINFDSNSLPFANTIISINKTNTNFVFESEYTSKGLNENSILYNSQALTDELFESFVSAHSNRNGSTNDFEFKNDYKIVDEDEYNKLMAYQNRDYPFLNNGYQNDYNVKDQFLINASFYDGNNLIITGLLDNKIRNEKLSNWTITPLSNTEGSTYIFDAIGYGIPSMVVFVVKFTEIEIEIKKDVEAEDNTYFFGDSHRYFEYIDKYSYSNNTQDAVNIVSNGKTSAGLNEIKLKYSNLNSIPGVEMVNDIKLHFVVVKSELKTNEHIHTGLKETSIYDKYAHPYTPGGENVSLPSSQFYSYEYSDKMFILASNNAGIYTSKVSVEVEKLELSGYNTISKITETHEIDIEGIGTTEFESVDKNLKIEVTINIYDVNKEILSFKVDATGIYKITISTESYINLSTTLLDAEGNQLSLSPYKIEMNLTYGSGVVRTDAIANGTVQIPLHANRVELKSIEIIARGEDKYQGADFEMVPVSILYEGDAELMAENEFNFENIIEAHVNNFYKNEHISGKIDVKDAHIKVVESNKPINIIVNYDYSRRTTHIEKSSTSTLLRHDIDLEYSYLSQAANGIKYSETVNSFRSNVKVHKDGFIIKLSNLTKQNEETELGEKYGIEDSDNIYKIDETDKLVRVLILVKEYENEKPVGYNEFVSINGRNPEKHDDPEKIDDYDIITNEIWFDYNLVQTQRIFVEINIYEVFEVEIKTDLTESVFGTSDGLMPIVSLESADLPKVQDTDIKLLNAYKSNSIVDEETNVTIMLAEFGTVFKLSSSQDHIEEGVKRDRFIFERWTGVPDNYSDEGTLETGPIKTTRRYTARYTLKTVEVFTSLNINYLDDEGGELTLPVPKLVISDSEPIELVRSNDNKLARTYFYEYNGKTIVSSQPNLQLPGDRFELPYYDVETGEFVEHENGYDPSMTHRFSRRLITYGEEIHFIVPNYSSMDDNVLKNLKLGEYRFFKTPEPGSVKVNIDDEIESIGGSVIYDETGQPIKFSVIVTESFIAYNSYLTKLTTTARYRVGSTNINGGPNNVFVTGDDYSDIDETGSSAVSSFTTYLNPNVKIEYNLTEIARDHGLDVNSLTVDWRIEMNLNYKALEGENWLSNQRIGITLDAEGERITNHINFVTSIRENENGDKIFVIEYKALILQFTTSTMQSEWQTRVTDTMIVALRITV